MNTTKSCWKASTKREIARGRRWNRGGGSRRRGRRRGWRGGHRRKKAPRRKWPVEDPLQKQIVSNRMPPLREVAQLRIPTVVELPKMQIVVQRIMLPENARHKMM